MMNSKVPHLVKCFESQVIHSHHFLIYVYKCWNRDHTVYNLFLPNVILVPITDPA